ncbi:hypothetical protein CTA1_4110 [Colletotrichum tanaceti]|uniref:Uncharacterized protein n=1 Tax=Colletotrichum tanaceti TaxID=1306861 RepID=A0A4U6XIA6_9PEZI|nr:hypothetical protein CTA1_4110 [Colletotrichum tanaceti]
MPKEHREEGHHSINATDAHQHAHVAPYPVQVEAGAPRGRLDVVEIAKGRDELAEVDLGEPGAGGSAPEPLHVPVLDAGQGRGGAGQDGDDEADHGGEQRGVLAADEHADDAGEAVDAVKVEGVDEEGEAPVDDGHGQEEEQRGEVQAGEEHARQHGEDLGEEVGRAGVAGLGLPALGEQLLGEGLDAGGAGDEADGDGDEEGQLRGGLEVDGGREDGVGLVEGADEEDALLGVLGQAEEEAGEGGEAHLGQEGRLGAPLLEHGPPQAEPRLLPERRAAVLDGGVHARVARDGRGRALLLVCYCRGQAAVARPVGDEGVGGDVVAVAAAGSPLVVAAVASDDVGDDVAVVAVGREDEAQALKVVLHAALGALVDGLAVAQEDEVVKEVKDLGARLVDDDDDGDAEAGDGLEGAHHGRGGGGVEAAGGLVEEDGHRGGGELHADAHALALAAADDGPRDGSHQRVAHVGQLQAVDDGLGVGIDVGPRPGPGQPDLGAVDNVLADGELRQHDVVLRHVADDLSVPPQLVRPAAVDGDRAARVLGLAHEHVDKGRLAGPGAAHDGREGAAVDGARHVVEDLPGALPGLEAEVGVAEGQAKVRDVGRPAHRRDEGHELRVELLARRPRGDRGPGPGPGPGVEVEGGQEPAAVRVGASRRIRRACGEHLPVRVVRDGPVAGDLGPEAAHAAVRQGRPHGCRRRRWRRRRFVGLPVLKALADLVDDHAHDQQDVDDDQDDEGDEEEFVGGAFRAPAAGQARRRGRRSGLAIMAGRADAGDLSVLLGRAVMAGLTDDRLEGAHANVFALKGAREPGQSGLLTATQRRTVLGQRVDGVILTFVWC